MELTLETPDQARQRTESSSPIIPKTPSVMDNLREAQKSGDPVSIAAAQQVAAEKYNLPITTPSKIKLLEVTGKIKEETQGRDNVRIEAQKVRLESIENELLSMLNKFHKVDLLSLKRRVISGEMQDVFLTVDFVNSAAFDKFLENAKDGFFYKGISDEEDLIFSALIQEINFLKNGVSMENASKRLLELKEEISAISLEVKRLSSEIDKFPKPSQNFLSFLLLQKPKKNIEPKYVESYRIKLNKDLKTLNSLKAELKSLVKK